MKHSMSRETRTARLTILIDPNKKAVFEELCLREDLTPSQVVRRLVRTYIEQKLGRPWKPGERLALPTRPLQSNGTERDTKSRTKKSR
jgi:hypothetical protein